MDCPDCAANRPAKPRLKDDHDRGLYNKYKVTRTDGSSRKGRRHHGCHYFVLDITHDKYAIIAMAAYAAACRDEFPMLAHDLLSFVKWKP